MRGVLAVALLALAGCARYVPQPVEPVVHAAVYQARRLDDTALVAWVARWAGRPEGKRWTDRQLAVAALALRADLARARADWLVAVAGERTAGVRPPPGAQADVERAVSGSEELSPWVVSLAGLFAVELGGKRGARLQRARARTAAAEGEVRLSAWGIVREVRAAVAAVAAAEAELTQSRREVEQLAGVQVLEQGRFQEASLTSAELARTGAELQGAKAQSSAAEAVAYEARAALAGGLAVPGRALEALAVAVDTTSGCAELEALGEDSLTTDALLLRPEMGRVLAEYAIAEADLRLEVARQFPDLDLGPGFIWDQGVNRWTLALTLPNLLGFRRRAAIDEAAAARTAAAARVAEVQDGLLAELAFAIGRCRGAALGRTTADSQVAASQHAAEIARAAYQRGETSRLEPALAELAVARAERARAEAEARLRSAGQSLETAAGRWGDLTPSQWPDPLRDQLGVEPPK